MEGGKRAHIPFILGHVLYYLIFLSMVLVVVIPAIVYVAISCGEPIWLGPLLLLLLVSGLSFFEVIRKHL